ncbi:prepilin peptidase [Clostridium sp.]|uniref:A24 family peptidase n=1 Tax=Clostridium sp. TaxID=1506 RepID=UPI003418891B
MVATIIKTLCLIIILIINNYYLITEYKDNIKIMIVFYVLAFSLCFYFRNSLTLLLIPTLINITIKDFKDLRIPHVYNLILLITNMITAILYGKSIIQAVILMLIMFVIFFIPYIFNKVGGGDLLLIPNLVCFFKYNQIIYFLFLSSIMAIIIYITLYKREGKKEVPFGPSMCLSYLIISLLF